MNIEATFRRLAALHVQDEGNIAVIWLAHDKETDCVHLYDACLFKAEVFSVIVEGLNARGRWIPIVWEKNSEDIAENLKERGCTMWPYPGIDKPYKETAPVREVTTRDIWERMRTGRFKVDKRLGEWLEEYRTFYREDAQVPKDSAPLMSATRHAIANLDRAKPQSKMKKRRTENFPKVSMI